MSIREVIDGFLARAARPIEVRQVAERVRPIDLPILVGDASRLRALTGWAPDDLLPAEPRGRAGRLAPARLTRAPAVRLKSHGRTPRRSVPIPRPDRDARPAGAPGALPRLLPRLPLVVPEPAAPDAGVRPRVLDLPPGADGGVRGLPVLRAPSLAVVLVLARPRRRRHRRLGGAGQAGPVPGGGASAGLRPREPDQHAAVAAPPLRVPPGLRHPPARGAAVPAAAPRPPAPPHHRPRAGAGGAQRPSPGRGADPDERADAAVLPDADPLSGVHRPDDAPPERDPGRAAPAAVLPEPDRGARSELPEHLLLRPRAALDPPRHREPSARRSRWSVAGGCSTASATAWPRRSDAGERDARAPRRSRSPSGTSRSASGSTGGARSPP